LFQHFPLPSLSLTLLNEKLPSIAAADRHPADVIERDLDTTAGKENSPALNWRGQVQLKMADRNKVSRDFHVMGRLSGRGSAKHIYISNSIRKFFNGGAAQGRRGRDWCSGE
jgi:hypothetical protein